MSQPQNREQYYLHQIISILLEAYTRLWYIASGCCKARQAVILPTGRVAAILPPHPLGNQGKEVRYEYI